MGRPCEQCGTSLVDPDDVRGAPAGWMCAACYQEGWLLLDNLAGAIEVLNEAARRAGITAGWQVIPATSDGQWSGLVLLLELADPPNPQGGPYLRITPHGGPYGRPFTGNDTIAEIEKVGWRLFAHQEDDGIQKEWPPESELVERMFDMATAWANARLLDPPPRPRGLETEQLPMLIAEAATWAQPKENDDADSVQAS